MIRMIQKYPAEEYARHGKEIYEKIRAKVEPGNIGKFFAVDIDTGEYEIDEDSIAVSDRLYARLPETQVFCLRMGYETMYSFGGQERRTTPC